MCLFPEQCSIKEALAAEGTCIRTHLTNCDILIDHSYTQHLLHPKMASDGSAPAKTLHAHTHQFKNDHWLT